MSSAVDVQIVSTPNLEKIENFFKDSTYRETIEFSANFNTRLCIERRLRLPFLDPQTGVAQNHSNLFMTKRQRMPGFREGQIYTYPAQRWRKSRRQYLNKGYRFPDRPFQALRKDHESLLANCAVVGTASPIVGTASAVLTDPDFNGTLLEESSSLGAFGGGGGGDTSDSKDSQQQPQLPQPQHQQHFKEDISKDWFYDDIDINDVDSLEEPKSPADDEYDYDPRYGSKKRRKRRPGKRAALIPGEGSAGRRRSGAGRGRGSSSTAAASAVAAAVAGTSSTDISLMGGNVVDGCGIPPTEGIVVTTIASGKRSRGSGTRGRRRTKVLASANCDPPSPGLNSEPPSFEMAAAAVGVVSDLGGVVAPEEHSDLRNYRKYL